MFKKIVGVFLFVILILTGFYLAPKNVSSQVTQNTLTLQINSNSDDVNEVSGNFYDSSDFWVGTGGSQTASFAGVRFNNVTILKNANIVSAHLEFNSSTTQWIGVGYDIYSEASGNSATFSSTDKPSQRALTTAKVSHTSDNQWTQGSWYNSEEIKSILQEIVQRSDWISGNSLSFILKGTVGTWGRKFVTSYNSNPALAVKLVVTYEDFSPTPTPTPTPSPTPTPIPSVAPSVQLIGSPEVVFDWTTDRCENNHIPDLPARAFKDANGKVQLLAPHFDNYRWIGNSLDTVSEDCTQKIYSSANDTNYDNHKYHEWVGAPYTEDGTNIYSLVHNEWYPYLVNPSCTSSSNITTLTMVNSSNGGVTYSHPLDYKVWTHPVPWDNTFSCTQANPTSYGAFHPSNIIKKGTYYYAMYQSSPDPNNVTGPGLCLMRTQNLTLGSAWEVWKGPGTTDWDTGIGARCRRVNISGSMGVPASLTFNTFLNSYILLGNQWDATGKVTGVYYSLSADLFNWTAPIKILDPDPVLPLTPYYPSLLDPTSTSTNFETTGQESYIYYTRFNDVTGGLDRDLMRQKVRFLPQSTPSPTCSQWERLLGDWCVYTNTDSLADVVVTGFENIYHPNVWNRGGVWNMVVGGWRDGASQNYKDRVYRLQTTDPSGMSNWQIVPGYTGLDFYIDNKFEDSTSMDYDSSITQDRDGNPTIPYEAFHAVQPALFPFEQYPLKPDGTPYTCCDTLLYSFDYAGFFPEKYVGINQVYIANDGSINKAGAFGDKNPLIDWRTYGSATPTVGAVSDGNITYDPKTNKFYLVYGEWYLNTFTPDGGSAVTSIASSTWTNMRFTPLVRDLFNGTYGGNPQIVVGPDNKYYLFYTRFTGGIKVAVANDITGPYTNSKTVIPTNSQLTTLGTPYVFCNTNTNQWQMYFYGSSTPLNNQIYTAFLHQPCFLPPVLSSTPTPSPTPTPTPTPLPCTLTSASWSKTSSYKDDVVTLTATTNNVLDCAGKQVHFLVRENDSILEGGVDEDASEQPLPNPATIVGSQAVTSWIVESQNDCNGSCNPPEYFFKAWINDPNIYIEPNQRLLVVDQTTPPPTPATGKVFLQKDNTRVGFSLDWGGSLTDFLYNGQEIVNRYDDGREIQTAFYDGSAKYDSCAGCTGVFGWDPVQGGDKYNHGSKVVAYSTSNNHVYTKAIANQWYPDDKGGGANQEVPSDTIIEQWASLEPYQDTVKLHYRITHTGTDNHTLGHQEFPATYVNLDVNTLTHYQGTSPWTNDVLTTTTLTASGYGVNPFSFYNPEDWASLTNSNNVGVTVFVPGTQHYISGNSYTGATEPTGDGTHYLKFIEPYSFGPGETLQGDIYIIGGDAQAARQTVYAIKNNIPISHLFDPLGYLDQPTPNQTLTGSKLVSGWVFDTLPVSEVKIYLDNNFVADAAYGTSRPDVQTVYPNALVNIGFTYQLDTKLYTNGTHDLRVDIKTSDGKVAPLNQIQIVINNPLPIDSFWSMDETSWNGTVGEVIDSSGNSNHSTASCNGTGCTIPTTTTGKLNNGGNFDGVDDYLVSSTNVFDPSQIDFTASIWFKPNQIGTFKVLISQQDGGGTGRYWLAQTAGGLLTTNITGTSFNGITTLSANNWYHATLTKSGPTMTLYLNGIQESTASGTVSSANGNSVIGANKLTNANFFSGTLDEARIYKRALTAAEVLQLYNSYPNEVTISRQPSQSSDDVNEVNSTYSSSSSTLWIGNANSTTKSYFGARFNNISIPKGATIKKAYLEVYSTKDQWINLSYNMYAENIGNSSTFSSSSRPSQRTLTQNFVAHNSNISWSTNTWYTLDDMSQVVQEIVNRSDWQSGNSVSLIIKGTGGNWARKFIRSFDGSSQFAPKLTVVYQ